MKLPLRKLYHSLKLFERHKHSMSTSMPVSVRLKTDAEAVIVDRFFLNYFYDMSQWDTGIIVNKHGLPCWHGFSGQTPTTNEECVKYNWWIRDECLAYLIFVGEIPVGFAMVCSVAARLPEHCDHELVDFYIMPKFRQQGYGKQAAARIFELHRGRWILFQLADNKAARGFWQGMLSAYTAGKFVNHENGLSQRFDNTSFARILDNA